MLEYHAALIADEVRTRAFVDALKSVVRPGMHVLDVGTGTGILALTAAKLGARVTAVEQSYMMDYAQLLALANNAEITFVRKNIIEVNSDEIEPADVVVSEMIGNALLDEALIPVIRAARRFLKPGGTLIPRSASFSAALVNSAMIREAVEFWKTPRFDIDFSALAECMSYSRFDDRLKDSSLLGTPATFPPIDLTTTTSDRYRGSATLRATSDGECNAVLTWWNAILLPGIELSQTPTGHWAKQHWFRSLFPVIPRTVKKDDELAFRLDHDALSGIWSWRLGDDHRSTFFAIPPKLD